jgi:carbamoyltransferase
MNVLGISAFYHDSAACLVRDGKIAAAAEEERFSRKKHDASFPESAIRYCLTEGGLEAKDLDLVAFYEKPLIKFERILESQLAYVPRGFRVFANAMPRWMKSHLWIKDVIASELGFAGKILFPSHHESHAAAAFFPSPFPKAAILTMDGVGEWATTSHGAGENNSVRLLEEIRFPHSLGLLYSAFTYYAGFKVNSGEYKLMGLAPYGKPRFSSLIREHLIDLREDGSFRLNMDYFNYGAGLTMTNARFHDLFGAPPRIPESPLDARIQDLARSVQEVLEEAVLRLGRHVHRETGLDRLCLGGGVALNCVANGRLLREGPFRDLWIQPAAGDAGGAVGAALFAWHQVHGAKRAPDEGRDAQSGSLLGPSFSSAEIRTFLDGHGIPYRELNAEALSESAADRIQAQEVVGWFQGRMEFGPRALGGRSILGDARNPRMRELINEKVKYREAFRPFAAAVLREKVGEYFDLQTDSPYMLLVAQVKGGEETSIPAVRHVDGSARIQTVDGSAEPSFRELLLKFDEKYGCAALLNTSFNVRGEPMVCTPEEAYSCFRRTGLDCLFLGNFLLDKNDKHPAWDFTGPEPEPD